MGRRLGDARALLTAGPGGDFSAVAQLQFLENPSDVGFNGIFRDSQVFGDFAVATPLSERLDDVPFSLGEDGLFSGSGVDGAVELGPEGAGHAGRKDGFTVHNLIEGEKELLGLAGFEQVADGAAGDCLDEVLVVLRGGEDGDAKVGIAGGEGPRGLKGVHAREAQFGENEIGLRVGDDLERAATIAGLADNFVAVRLKQCGDAAPDEGLIVNKDDFHRCVYPPFPSPDCRSDHARAERCGACLAWCDERMWSTGGGDRRRGPARRIEGLVTEAGRSVATAT